MRPVPLAWLLAILTLAPTSGVGQSVMLTGQVHLTDAIPANAAVALVPLNGSPAPAQRDTVLIDQQELRFLPGVAVVEPGSTVLFRNSDPVMHNVFSPRKPGPGFNLGTYRRPGVVGQPFDAEGVHVILCHVHPEMVAYVVVAPTPYRAVTDAEGRFTIGGLPAGRYQAMVWWRRRLRIDTVITLVAGESRFVELDDGRKGGGQTP